jgi:hypothetical protein
MSGVGWKLRRLGAMSAGEVARRTSHAARDRWFAPAWTRLSAAGAYHALFRAPRAWGGAGATAAHERHARDLARAARWMPASSALPPEAVQAIRARGAALVRGEWSLFGKPARLPAAIDWNANPLGGARWPDAPSRTIDHRDAGATGGAKFAAELGRLTFAPELAWAGALGERGAGQRAVEVLAQFAARNPLGHGIQHTSAIEMAIRVATTSATLALLRDGGRALDDVLEPTLGLDAQQALWCRDHLSLGSSANNHLLAELMAMAIMGGVWPSLRGAEKLAREAHAGLQRQLLLQVHRDGVSAEQAFGYVPFIWELLLLGLRATEVAGLEPRPEVRERLAASLEFARVLRGPSGRAPQVGDEDDGRILLAGDPGSRIDLVGNALAAWLKVDALSDGASAYASLLGLAPTPVRLAADGRHEFAEGGWTVWREAGLRVTFDHGPLGLGKLAGHGHADALALTISRGDDDLVIDPGTLAYHEDEAARNESRSTPVHATVSFGARSQSEMLGPFLWGRRAVVTADGEGWRCRWVTGEEHARTVRVERGTIAIDDRVRGRDARLAFPLAPGAKARIEGGQAIVETGRSRAVFRAHGLGAWRLEPARVAPRFAQRADAQRLVADFAGDEARTVIEVAARE